MNDEEDNDVLLNISLFERTAYRLPRLCSPRHSAASDVRRSNELSPRECGDLTAFMNVVRSARRRTYEHLPDVVAARPRRARHGDGDVARVQRQLLDARRFRALLVNVEHYLRRSRPTWLDEGWQFERTVSCRWLTKD